MKAFVRWMAVLIALGGTAFAQTAAIQNHCTQGGVQANVSGLPSTNYLNGIIPSCTVTVYLTGTQTKATIYADGNNTPLSNPFTANAANSIDPGGWKLFAAVNQGYDVVMSGGIAPNVYKQPVTIVGVYPGFSFSGGGGSPSGPQYAIQTSNITAFGHSNAFTDATGNPLTVPGALTGKITNGGLNSDMYATGSGNNGIANALASCGSPCTVNVPATSTDTETPYTINTSGNHIFDQRGQSNGDFFYNPAVGGGAGYNPGGQPHSGAEEIYGKWDIPTQAPDFTQTQIGQSLNLSFNSPGWNFGTDTGYTGPLWADTNGLNISMTGSTPGIAGMITGINTTYHVGDSQAFALYTQPDGGWTDGAGEGSSGGILHRDQNTTWFHGTVNSGATHGTQLLQTTYVPGALSRPQASVGGYMLDISRLVGQFTVTGAATQVGSLSVFATPVTPSVTESTAWGSPNTDIPGPTNPEGTQTDTVTFTVLGGTNSGGYTTGVACLAGQQFFEQVLITAVGAISGGQQSVTFTHGYPNTHAGSSMWQGGICGDYYVPTLKYLNGWDAAYPIVGATDSSHVVGRLFAGETTKWPLPSPWGATTVNVPLVGLSISGTTVTATINSPSPAVFANVTGAVVSGATNSSFNGTTGSITVVNNNQLQWTQTGPTGTSASALLTLPSNNFVFYMIPGAPVTQPCTSAGCPLQPNNVAWTAGDNVENPFNPSFRGYGLTVESIVNSPSAAIIGGSGSLSLEDKGLGVGGGYSVFSWTNSSPLSQYVGAGGTLTAPTGILFSGALGPLLTSQYAPLDPGIASINIGCAIPSQGGCSSTNDIRWMSIGNTINGVAAFTASDFFDFSKLSAHTILRSRIASTGLGLTGDNPVALTSSNSVINDDVMGTYGAFGNETPLDTSALVGAKTFYAGLLHAGALAPTMNGVFVNGTPGSSTWSYTAKSVTQFGESLPATVATTNTGNATLDPTNNFNGLDITPGYGAQSTNVYRTAAPAGYSVGLICANVPNNVINGTSSGFGCKDSGQATLGPLTADTDTSGQVTSAAGAFGTSLTVAGQNVCEANGTNCPSSTSLPSGTPNQLLYYASAGTTVTPLTLGTNLSITGGVLNAAATSATNFNALTSGTNTTAAMVVGSGASLAATGTGTITATSMPYTGLTGTVPTWNQNTTGNAATASALASTPTLCSTGQAPTGILANGNATGCASSISGLTTGYIPLAASATTLGNSLLDYGVTNAGKFTFGAPVAVNDVSGSGGGFNGTEGTPPTGATGVDDIWADSTAHRLMMNNNNGGATGIVGFSDLTSSSTFGVAKVDGTTITASGGVISANTVYPGAGIPNSTGSAWGTSYTTTGSGTVVALATSPTFVTPSLGVATATSVNGTSIPSSATLTQTIASGTATLGTSAIASGTCATVVTATATGTATTDTLTASFNGDPTAVTGYIPSTSGMLTIISYPTANTANFKVCNNTSASITPGAITINWRVVR